MRYALSAAGACLLSVVVASPPAAEGQRGRQLALPSAPPPAESPEAAHTDFRFDPAKSTEENDQRQIAIQGKLEEWLRRLREFDAAIAVAGGGKVTALSLSAVEARERIERNVRAWQRRLGDFHIQNICGPVDRSQDVELYDGTLGPTRAFVDGRQPSTGQIQWNDNLAELFNKPGDDPGNVNGVRWCSGTLIGKATFLTAGHCFDIDPEDWRTPRRGDGTSSRPLSPPEFASHMHVNFNYQLDRVTRQPRTATVYRIAKLIAHRKGNVDFAVVELGAGSDGKLPGEHYAIETPDSSRSALRSATLLTVIQHPHGQPKKVAAGSKIAASDTLISYSDIDTLKGSSGAGIIDQHGRLIGVHTSGGCSLVGGANSGVPLYAVDKVWPISTK